MESKARDSSQHRRHYRSGNQSSNQEQPQVELALRSRGLPVESGSNVGTPDAVTGASADAVRRREDTQEAIPSYHRPHSHPAHDQEMSSQQHHDDSNLLEQHYDVNSVGHYAQQIPQVDFRQPVSARAPTRRESTTTSSRITNPVRPQDQPFSSQQRHALTYQYTPSPLNQLPGSAPAHDAMYATPFSGVPYIPSQFPEQAMPGSEALSKFSDHPMEILSAVQYDEGAALAVERSKTSSGHGQKHRNPHLQGQHSVFGLTGGFEMPGGQVTGRSSRTQSSKSGTADMPGGERRRKKQKLSDDEEEPDETTKKTRGRPRLDTKDETAADRRRTQIRMAQRAYRHRKETTIATLEKQVQELRGTNEEMNNIFISLYDFAVGKGLLQREPEFGQHLQSSTQRFLALARSISNEDPTREDDSGGGEGGFHGHSDQDIEPLPPPQEPRPTQAWGYQLEDPSYDPPPPAEQPPYHEQSINLPNRHGHQIVSRATTDNASFSFDLLDNMQQYRAEVPDPADQSQFFLNYQDISLPKSLAHKEVSFARILQRAAIEGGYKLITSPNPNPNRLNEVFGFCLRFASKDSIRKRLQDVVFSSSKDSLYAWREPFVHVGGSGTFYPIHEQGISGDLQPKFRTGMSMGPFSASVMQTKDKDFFDDFHTNVPGFEGEFFDANDVEGYLRGQGIEVPPNADFITLDLDLLPVYDIPSMESTIETVPDSCYSPKTPQSPVSHLRGLRSRASVESLPEELPQPLVNQLPQQPQDLDLSTLMSWANPFNPLDPITTQGASDGNKAADVNPFDLDGPIFNSLPALQHTVSNESDGNGRRRRRGEERLVTVAVAVLIEELVRRCVCLGRAPGFRPADVDSAIRRAIRASL